LPWSTTYTGGYIPNALSTAYLDNPNNYRNIPNTITQDGNPITALQLLNFIKEVLRLSTRRRFIRLIQYYNNKNNYQVEADNWNYALLNTNFTGDPSFTQTATSNDKILASQLLAVINDIKAVADAWVNNSVLTYSWTRCHTSCHSSCQTRGRR
jgi:hypothetical protein